MNRYRLISTVVTLGLLACAIAGCGTTAPAPAPTSPTAVVEQVAEQPTTAPTEALEQPTAPPPTEEAAPTAEPVATTAPASQGGQLVVGLDWEPTASDPHVSSADPTRILNRLVFDTLVVKGVDGTIHPSLATAWEVSDDGLTYTFHLRQGVKFHDGTPFNAEAVKYSFDRIVDPNTHSETAGSFMGPYESTEVVDEYTVKVRMKAPFAPWLPYLTVPTAAMVSPTAAKQWGEDFDNHLVGTGPFIFKEWVHGDHWLLERNPDYNWGSDAFHHQGPAYVDEILMKFITESTVRVGTLETGETQVITMVPPQDFVRLSQDSAYTTLVGSMGGVPESICINVTRPALSDLKVRQALEYAIDRQSILDTIWFGQWPAALGPLAPGNLGYWAGAEQLYGYDPEKATSLLDEAGWIDSNGDGIREKDGTPLLLQMPAIEWMEENQMAEMVQAQLKEVGIDVNVQPMQYAAEWEMASKCEHDLAACGFYSGDSDDLASLFLSSNVGPGYAWTCAKNTQLDDLLIKGRAATAPDARAGFYTEAQQLIMDQALIKPIHLWTTLTAARSELKGLWLDPDGMTLMFYDAYLEK
jgi:peptide/nickel transport system substrate-binding protein